MSDWSPPWPTNGGNIDFLRVSASVLGQAGRPHCPEERALKVRPAVYPQTPPGPPRRYSRYETFLLGVIRDAVLAVEAGDVPAGPEHSLDAVADTALNHVVEHGNVKGEVPEMARRWVRHGIATYLDAAEAFAEAEGLVPGPPQGWVITNQRGQVVSEMTVWGFTYVSADGRLRELRLPRMYPAAHRDPPPAQMVAAAAFVTGTGVRPLTGDNRYEPYMPTSRPDPVPDQVRVRTVALLDGSSSLLWEGTPADATQLWQPHRPLVGPLASGGGTRPGRDCLKCSAVSVCDALPETPGLLGLPSFGTHPRILAPTALSVWRRCPAKYLFTKEVLLPREITPATPALERGFAAHRWLEVAHGRFTECSADDLPAPDRGGVGEVAEHAGIDATMYAEVHPYLVQHLDICPLQGDRVLDVWPERDLTVRDGDADVLVSYRPDLLASTLDGPVWRETKTIAQLPADGGEDVFELYPQIALGVCVFGDGATGEPRLDDDGADHAWVELELLSPGQVRLLRFDARDELTLAAARRALAASAHGWHGDDEFVAKPGPWCESCEVARWCPSAGDPAAGSVGVDVGGIRIDPNTGEVLDSGGHARVPTAAEAAAVTDVEAAEAVEEIPF